MWKDLQGTPIDEVRRRAAIVDRWNDIAAVEVPGGVRYGWNDGGGQASGWFFADDGRVLLLTFEHESPVNFQVRDYGGQAELFAGVPAELVELVANRPPSYEFSTVTDAATGNTLPHATGVFWFDGASWHIAPGLVTCCERRSVDVFAGSGFEYCTGDCLFGREFTPRP